MGPSNISTLLREAFNAIRNPNAVNITLDRLVEEGHIIEEEKSKLEEAFCDVQLLPDILFHSLVHFLISRPIPFSGIVLRPAYTGVCNFYFKYINKNEEKRDIHNWRVALGLLYDIPNNIIRKSKNPSYKPDVQYYRLLGSMTPTGVLGTLLGYPMHLGEVDERIPLIIADTVYYSLRRKSIFENERYQDMLQNRKSDAA